MRNSHWVGGKDHLLSEKGWLYPMKNAFLCKVSQPFYYKRLGTTGIDHPDLGVHIWKVKGKRDAGYTEIHSVILVLQLPDLTLPTPSAVSLCLSFNSLPTHCTSSSSLLPLFYSLMGAWKGGN